MKNTSPRITPTIDFTEAEKAYLDTSPTLTVAVLKNNYPLFYEEDGEACGMIPASLKLIEQPDFADFEYVYGETYAELGELVKTGQAQIIGGYLDDDKTADQTGWTRTPAYAKLDTVVLMHKQTRAARPMRMAVPAGLSAAPPQAEDEIVYYDTYKQCLEAVNEGKAGLSAAAGFLCRRSLFPQILCQRQFNDDEQRRWKLSLALPSPVNVLIYSIFSKSIHNSPRHSRSSLISENLLKVRQSAVTLESLVGIPIR